MHALPKRLTELESEWRRNNAPIADHLAAPATAEELAVVAQVLGVPLPPELLVWWGWWHNGVNRLQPGTRGGLEAGIGPIGMDFLSISEALLEREFMFDVAPPPEDTSLDGVFWMPTWLPFAKTDANVLFVDCSAVTRDGTVAVHAWWHTPENLHVPLSGSFTSAVAVWVAQLQDGAFSCDSHGYWLRREPPTATTIALTAYGPL